MKLRILILTLTVLTVACSKEQSKEAPRLDAPDKGGYSVEAVPAAATVSASSGPIKITLNVAKTTIPYSARSLWVKLTLENVGTTGYWISNLAFFDGPMQLWHRHEPLSLELVGDDGEPMTWVSAENHEPPSKCWPGDSAKRLEENDPALLFAIQQGARETFRRYAEQGSPPNPERIWLKPGESITTAPIAYQDLESAWCGKKPRPKPLGDFGEIPHFTYSAGKFKLRAVYRKNRGDLGKEFVKAMEDLGPPGPLEITFVTPWIDIEVPER
ncbi:MAG: hypothetical protein COB53_09820 [Elusimicrobia bacterium]|nr:MAG: hypothetical protein COB53_09820 [Elusimicrobiota bacterium]